MVQQQGRSGSVATRRGGGLYKARTANSPHRRMREGRRTRRQAQLPADEQQNHGGRLFLILLVHARTCRPHPCALSSIGRAPNAPVRPRLLCHSRTPRTIREHLDDVPEGWFLRSLYNRTLHGSRAHVFQTQKARLQP